MLSSAVKQEVLNQRTAVHVLELAKRHIIVHCVCGIFHQKFRRF